MKPPVIIIGAGRSGTNALRNALCGLPAFTTWPCDEINYIWRSGNRDHPTDELLPAHATPSVAHSIRRAFDRRSRRQVDQRLVEKTCANSLRVGFVHAVVPEAFFVHIVRDGRDVTSSAIERWTAPLDLAYLARKARFVPPRDLPYYARRYGSSRLARRRSSDGSLSTWGPRFEGMAELVAGGAALDVVCASQWAACVDRSITQLAPIDPTRVVHVRYEDLVADPSRHLRRIVDLTGDDVTDIELARSAATLSGSNVSTWEDRLEPAAVDRIMPIIDPIHDRLAAPR